MDTQEIWQPNALETYRPFRDHDYTTEYSAVVLSLDFVHVLNPRGAYEYIEQLYPRDARRAEMMKDYTVKGKSQPITADVWFGTFKDYDRAAVSTLALNTNNNTLVVGIPQPYQTGEELIPGVGRIERKTAYNNRLFTYERGGEEQRTPDVPVINLTTRPSDRYEGRLEMRLESGMSHAFYPYDPENHDVREHAIIYVDSDGGVKLHERNDEGELLYHNGDIDSPVEYEITSLPELIAILYEANTGFQPHDDAHETDIELYAEIENAARMSVTVPQFTDYVDESLMRQAFTLSIDAGETANLDDERIHLGAQEYLLALARREGDHFPHTLLQLLDYRILQYYYRQARETNRVDWDAMQKLGIETHAFAAEELTWDSLVDWLNKHHVALPAVSAFGHPNGLTQNQRLGDLLQKHAVRIARRIYRIDRHSRRRAEEGYIDIAADLVQRLTEVSHGAVQLDQKVHSNDLMLDVQREQMALLFQEEKSMALAAGMIAGMQQLVESMRFNKMIQTRSEMKALEFLTARSMEAQALSGSVNPELARLAETITYQLQTGDITGIDASQIPTQHHTELMQLGHQALVANVETEVPEDE